MEKVLPFPRSLGEEEHPFHYVVTGEEPIATRLGWFEQALKAGREANKLDTRESYGLISWRNYGRPLDILIEYPGPWNPDTNQIGNIKLVKLLLQYGADPRLKSCDQKERPWERTQVTRKGQRL